MAQEIRLRRSALVFRWMLGARQDLLHLAPAPVGAFMFNMAEAHFVTQSLVF